MRARTILTSVCALVLLTICAVSSSATPLDKRTTFTFNAPVAVPGVVLPAGSYVFRLADDYRGRDIVQVLSADRGIPYAMFHSLRTLPAAAPVDNAEIRFMETAEDMPAAIRSWWYPGERQGYEFMYPREQARLLAKGTGTRVLTEAPATEPAPEYVWEVPEEPAAPVIAPEVPVLVGQVAEAVEQVPAPAEEPAPVTLPKTASPTATLVFAGVLMLLAALALRVTRSAGA